MATTQTVKVKFDDQVVERHWSVANEKFDWMPFPIGYGILLNERYQFPMDMALVRTKLDTKRQLFVDNHMIAHLQGIVRETEAARDNPDNPIFAPYVNYPAFISPDPQAVNQATTGGPIVKDDELWYYYRGCTIDGPKNTHRSALGLATLRRDGFALLTPMRTGDWSSRGRSSLKAKVT